MASSILSPPKPFFLYPTTSRSHRLSTAFSFNPARSPISFALSSTTPLKPHSKSIMCSAKPCSRPEYIPNHIPDPSYVRVFDTTLRDGEQSPGATMTRDQKLVIARQLSRLGVDIIEAGFPASSPDDLDAVRSIAIEVGNDPMGDDGHIPVICGLSRCNKGDIEAAWEAVKHAKKPRIHTFIATSGVHMQHKLRKTKEEVVAIARDMVAYAYSLGCRDIEFSPEDAGRSDREFLYHILEEVIKAGATTLNIPDTVGYNVVGEFPNLIADIKKNTKGIENAIISTHCQNDLGLATANTLWGVYAGARQVEVTINGIGERAGNASLEEVVLAIKCRQNAIEGVYTGINTQQIMMSSKMVQEHSGLMVQPHKAIVGANAFAHESGIHQDGMLKHKETYEIISPEDIGLFRSNEYGIVLGKLSGRHAVKNRLVELGYDISDEEFEDFFKRYKEVAEKKKRVTDEDIKALLFDEIFQPKDIWSIGGIQVTCGDFGLSTAVVKLVASDGEEKIASGEGTGPVDAAYKAIDTIVQVPTVLREYSMNSVTEGIDAIATTRVVISGDSSIASKYTLTEGTFNRTFSGSGAAMDVVVSSVRAYLSALNKMLSFVTVVNATRESSPEGIHQNTKQQSSE